MVKNGEKLTFASLIGSLLASMMADARKGRKLRHEETTRRDASSQPAASAQPSQTVEFRGPQRSWSFIEKGNSPSF